MVARVAGDRLPEAAAAGARISHYYGAAELSFVAWLRATSPSASTPRALPAVDSTLRIQLPTDELHVFDAATGDRLG